MSDKSKVWFCDMHTVGEQNLQSKLKKLMKAAGFESIDFNNKFAAIKLHFGEPGNLAYLRPNYSKTVADYVKQLGGKPFLTDANTLYVGRRKDALEHIESAYENGFSPFQTGCHIIIADGLKGTDEVHVPINCKYVKEAKIGRAVMDADVVISLTHFKGHGVTGFGGVLKNIGMGCGSRAGKMEMHNSGKPTVTTEKCVGCGICTKFCAHNAITVENKKASINHDKCVGCGRCLPNCAADAIDIGWDEAKEVLDMKIAEYAYAVVKDRPCFHICLVVDVSPLCDCCGGNDVPLTPDVGMFASFDPVALDVACGQSLVPFINDENRDRMKGLNPDSEWMRSLKYAAEELHMGNMEYELIRV